MATTNPFAPGATGVIALSGSSQTIAIDANATVVRVVNDSSSIAFFAFAATATTSSTPVEPGVTETFSKGIGVAVFSAVGTTGNIYATTGEGL